MSSTPTVPELREGNWDGVGVQQPHQKQPHSHSRSSHRDRNNNALGTQHSTLHKSREIWKKKESSCHRLPLEYPPSLAAPHPAAHCPTGLESQLLFSASARGLLTDIAAHSRFHRVAASGSGGGGVAEVLPGKPHVQAASGSPAPSASHSLHSYVADFMELPLSTLKSA